MDFRRVDLANLEIGGYENLRLALQIKCTSLHAIDMSDIRDEINCFSFQMKLKLNKIKSVSSLVENHCLILIVQGKCQENDTR